MPAAIAAEEVRGRRTAANELDVDVSRLAHDVAEEPSVAIDVVEGPIPLELHRRARRHQALELALRFTREALALAELGSVDLDEPHAQPTSHVERVPVADTLYHGASARSAAGRRRAGERQREQECGSASTQTRGSSSIPARFAFSLRSRYQATRRSPPKTTTKAVPMPILNQIRSKIRMTSTPSKRNAMAAPASLKP